MSKLQLRNIRKPVKPRKPTKPKILSKTVKVDKCIAKLPGYKKNYLSSIIDNLPPGVQIKDCYLRTDPHYPYNRICIMCTYEEPNKDFSEESPKYKKALEKYNKKMNAYDEKMNKYKASVQEYNDFQELNKLTETISPSQLKQMIENNL